MSASGQDPFTGMWVFSGARGLARREIASIGKKAGAVTLTDTLKVSPDGELLTLTYSLYDGG